MGSYDAFNGYAQLKGVYKHHQSVAEKFNTA
jgi:hypothetical protein